MLIPSGTLVRNLTFQSNDLGRETTILLVFDANVEGLCGTIYPVVWKTFTFPKTGSSSFEVTYTNDLAFFTADIEDENVIRTFTKFKLKPGQKTTLSLKNESDTLSFSPPVDGTSGCLTAENKTGLVQDLAVGFFASSYFTANEPVPALFFKEVEDGSNATIQWKPVLRVYIESGYRETEVLVDAISSTAIWEHDLHQLFRNTTLNLERNRITGRCTLKKTKP
ncbi:uncharacterized protein EDB93DRAFT_332169 [Suillus bovinus]|uniref:uncharacterized protein n=1 Tax=Suillus bovinus TaxID=48563 RepID=UPI001B86391B|nr:uncharacterized protein EDB93DRAFT_332169 [Suillus bovinus]KAG2150727.1 hypothetical protein EDB93DRAFT_332169 [Suillus bovinus]